MAPLNPKTANRLLWTAQVLVALLFLFAGAMKLVMPIERMQGPITFPIAFVRFIGVAEVLGALGLILPGLLQIRTELTSFAASGLAIIMIGATVVTTAGMGMASASVPLIVGLVAASIANLRWRGVPIAAGSRPHVLQTN